MARPILDRRPGDGGDDPGPTLPDPPAPTTLPGALGAKWRALGGDKWGSPSHKPIVQGGGSWVQFQLLGGSLASMFYRARPERWWCTRG